MKLLERDGYQCVVTGRLDAAHPTYKDVPGADLFVLEGCHILRRAIAIFNAQGDPDAVRLLESLFGRG
jgi:hypothetical protein